MLHSLLYIAPFVVLYFIMGAVYATAMIAVLWVTHILIDTGTCYFDRKNKQTLVFLADQALHIGMICLLLRFVTFSCYIDDYYVVLKVVFVGLMLLMPCSILINKLLQDIYPESEEMGIFDIGSMIGIMERIIITIKTWARTDDLKESEFRNKYLLGTLTSMVLALVIFIIYKLL